MSCTISAVGRTFDVDAFLRRSTFRPDRLWRKGDPVRPGDPAGGVKPLSGFSKTIGRDDFSPLKVQVRAAVRFLEREANRRVLKALVKTKGVQNVVLDFGITWEPVVAQFDALPPRLISLAGSLGMWIVVSHYPVTGVGVGQRSRGVS